MTISVLRTPIETKTVTNLPPGEETTITFTWNTTGVALGDYIISAYAWPVPGETDTTGNTYINGEVYVGIPDDVDGDGDVDPDDFAIFAGNYGKIDP